MKKILVIIIIVVGIAVLFYTTRDKFPANKTDAPATSKNDTFRPDPSNATFTFDDEAVTLSAGRNENDNTSEETILLDKFAYGDINNDKKVDTILFLIRSGMGSGTFIYLGAYVSGPVTYRGSVATFLGDRIAPESISTSKGIVTIKYLDRGPDDAFTVEPTIPVSKQFIFKNGEFVER